jgi:hypothetical protein
MELAQLENIWKDYDHKLSNNNRINKEILRKLLFQKPEKRLNWIRIKAVFNLLSPLLFFFLIEILNVKFAFESNFYIGLTLFLPVYLITYYWDIKYFVLTRGIDIASSILTIKKTIVELEKYKIKTTRIKYLLMPIAMVGFLLMIIHEFTFQANILSIVPLILIVLVYLASFYYAFKFSIYEMFKKLNSEIDEIMALEKE